MNNKIGEAENWHFAFLDRQDAFNELMSKEPKPSKKPTNEHNPIVCDDTTTLKKGTRIWSHGKHGRRGKYRNVTRLLR